MPTGGNDALTLAFVALIGGTMLVSSILSGIFGMAGGMILLGLLLYLFPVTEAMALHGVTQIASNGWRGLLWIRYVRWPAAAAFLAGSAIAFAIWVVWRYIPSKPVTLLLLGISPFIVRLLPANLKPDPERPLHGILAGGASMALMLIAGVSGPLIDTFFLGGTYDRRQIVATKAICQIVSHAAKAAYFGAVVAEAHPETTLLALAVIMPIIGTSLARPILDRLSDTQYRLWANRIITTMALFYLGQAAYLAFIAP